MADGDMKDLMEKSKQLMEDGLKKRREVVSYTVKDLEKGKEGFSGDTIRKQLRDQLEADGYEPTKGENTRWEREATGNPVTWQQTEQKRLWTGLEKRLKKIENDDEWIANAGNRTTISPSVEG